MRKPVCVTCQVDMVLDHVGKTIVEMAGDPPRPYKVWATDVVKCPRCGATVTWGCAPRPFAISHETTFQEEFQEELEAVPEEDRVYCYEARNHPARFRFGRKLCSHHYQAEFDKLPNTRRWEASYWKHVAPEICELCMTGQTRSGVG